MDLQPDPLPDDIDALKAALIAAQTDLAEVQSELATPGPGSPTIRR